jgi:nitric oxide reductase subunit C
MSASFTKSMARNIFYGGTAFFILLFLALTFHTTRALPERDHRENITAQVAMGKALWEENNCIGCHTLLGEGAYFAPELGNVYVRYGGSKDAIKGFIKSRPKDGIPGRRSMPQFNFTDEQLDALAEFLKWTSEINAADWPPNVQG